MQEFASTSLFIDISHVAQVCEEEWRSFVEDNELDPIPERQDLRGFLLNWVAVFLPEAFPHSTESPHPLVLEMAGWMEAQEKLDHPVFGFMKPPFIGATLFALTGDEFFLRCQTENFAYGGSQERILLQRSLTLVAPRMSFNEELVARLNYCMKISYFFMSTPLLLYAVSVGDSDSKIDQFNKWKNSFFMNTEEERIVDCFLAGEAAENPLESWLLRNTTYVMLRLASSSISSPTKVPLGLLLSDVWERVGEHPLFAPYVRLIRTGGSETDPPIPPVSSQTADKQPNPTLRPLGLSKELRRGIQAYLNAPVESRHLAAAQAMDNPTAPLCPQRTEAKPDPTQNAEVPEPQVKSQQPNPPELRLKEAADRIQQKAIESMRERAKDPNYQVPY